MITLSIVMAVYNGECYVREAIESILTQTFQDFEFIIINDGSTDHTWKILQSYSDPRLLLVNNDKNIGLARSLNKGLRLAKGNYIARQDADDISEPERLANQVAFLEAHSEIALVGTSYKEIDTQGNLIQIRTLPCNHIEIQWALLFYCPFVHSAVMFRKETVLESIGYYNEALSYSMDYDLWFRIACSLPIANLTKPLLRLRTNPRSMTATYGDRTLEGFNMRVATVTQLLGNDANAITSNITLYNRMTMLLFNFGTDTPLKPLVAMEVAKQVLKLQVAFCSFFQINQQNAQLHRQLLCAQISHQLITLVENQLHQDRSASFLLVLQAYFLNPRILISKLYLSILIKLLPGVYLFKKVKYLAQRI